jgi:ABC-type Mn2+/Zn2+ transport system permease subunit
MWWSVAIGVGSVVLGLALARIWALVPSGTIVLIAAASFAVVAIAKRGVVLRLRTGVAEP